MNKINIKFVVLMVCIYLFVRLSTGNVCQGLVAMGCFFIGALFGYADRIDDEKTEDKKNAKS